MCVNTFAAPVAMEKIGWRYYLVFVVWNCFETFVIWKWFVETAGHTLEQLTEIFESANPVKKSLEKRTVVLTQKGDGGVRVSEDV